MKRTSDQQRLRRYYRDHLAAIAAQSPFVVRITRWKDYPAPVLVFKERRPAGLRNGHTRSYPSKIDRPAGRGVLTDISFIYGDALRRCLPLLRRIAADVCGPDAVPLELPRFFTDQGFRLQLNLPLDDTAGAKLGLIGKLQMRVKELDRVELIARRVSRFTREEAAYWLSRLTTYHADANKWALTGMRIILAGPPQDRGIEPMLQKLRKQT